MQIYEISKELVGLINHHFKQHPERKVFDSAVLLVAEEVFVVRDSGGSRRYSLIEGSCYEYNDDGSKTRRLRMGLKSVLGMLPEECVCVEVIGSAEIILWLGETIEKYSIINSHVSEDPVVIDIEDLEIVGHADLFFDEVWRILNHGSISSIALVFEEYGNKLVCFAEWENKCKTEVTLHIDKSLWLRDLKTGFECSIPEGSGMPMYNALKELVNVLKELSTRAGYLINKKDDTLKVSTEGIEILTKRI